MLKLDIIIPAAGLGRRMKSYGPKALISIGKEFLINRQIRLLKAAYPHSRIIVVLGYEQEKIRKSLPKFVKVIQNRNFKNNNVAKSINLALEITNPKKSALIVYGDLAFNSETIENIPQNVSSVILENNGLREEEVGANLVDGKITHFSYGLNTKWAQIVMLAPKEKMLFIKNSSDNIAHKQFGYEILNKIIDSGGSFQGILKSDILLEIDTSKDIDNIYLLDKKQNLVK